MKIKKWVKHVVLNKSLKEIELDRILDKISQGDDLSERENNFLNLYKHTSDLELTDYVYLTDKSVYEKLTNLLNKNIKVIYNLSDKDGNIGVRIIKVYVDYEKDSVILGLKNGTEVVMGDHFFYSIINLGDYYSLVSGEEFIEKMEKNRDDE